MCLNKKIAKAYINNCIPYIKIKLYPFSFMPTLYAIKISPLKIFMINMKFIFLNAHYMHMCACMTAEYLWRIRHLFCIE